MQHGEEDDTGIDSAVLDMVFDQFAKDDRAGPAIALRAAFFRAGSALIFA